MGLNNGFLKTFIFKVNSEIIKVTLNYTKGVYTVYAPNGHILVRIEKLSQIKMNEIQKQVNDYLKGKCNQLPNFNRYRPNRGFRVA